MKKLDADTPPLLWGSTHPDVKGLTPVRKKNVPPTDRAHVEGATIDTGTAAPQFTMRIWRSREWNAAPATAFMFGLLALAFAVAGYKLDEQELMYVSAAAAAFLFWLFMFVRARAHVTLRVGFDWKTNTVWATHEKRRVPSWLGNANCITGFSVQTTDWWHLRYVPPPVGGPLHLLPARERTWHLFVHKTNDTAIPLYSFVKKKEANEALKNAQALLAAQ